MIENFEIITLDLSTDELKLVPLLIHGFKTHGKENPIKEPEICDAMNAYFYGQNIKYRMTGAKLRKYVNYIRSNGLIPLIATSRGYYVSYDKDVIMSQIKSLQQRADSINMSARGLEKFV